MTLDPGVRDTLMQVAVPTVVALLWRRGYRNTLIQSPRPLNPAAARFVGTAFTVRTVPVREDLLAAMGRGDRPNLQAGAVATIGPGEVLAVAMDGETRTAFMGDIMATHMEMKGVAGVVLDGAVSDAVAIAALRLPVFCCGSAAIPVTSHRFVAELNVAVGIGGVTVLPGDVLMGDANGVAVLPAALAAEIAQAAVERELLETFVTERVRMGADLAGTYPPDAATMAAFNAWRAAR